MSDDMNVPVVEDGNVSQYKERNEAEVNEISAFMDNLRSVPTKADFEALCEKTEKMGRVMVLFNEADAAADAQSWDEALAKVEEALGYGLPNVVAPAVKMKCYIHLNKGCDSRLCEELRNASALLSAEEAAGVEAEIFTVIYDNFLKLCWESFNEMTAVKLCGIAEQLVPLEKGVDCLIGLAARLGQIFQDEWVAARFVEYSRKTGWNIEWDSLVALLTETGFNYTKAAQERNDYADLLAPGTVATADFREKLDAIGINFLKRMLAIATDKEQKAGICEKLVMTILQTMDKVRLCRMKDTSAEGRKYFTMMKELSPAYRQQYETLMTQCELIEKKVKAANDEKMKLNNEIMDLRREANDISEEINSLKNGFFYCIDLFAKLDVSDLKDKRRIVGKCIDMKKRRIAELDAILAGTA